MKTGDRVFVVRDNSLAVQKGWVTIIHEQPITGAKFVFRLDEEYITCYAVKNEAGKKLYMFDYGRVFFNVVETADYLRESFRLYHKKQNEEYRALKEAFLEMKNTMNRIIYEYEESLKLLEWEIKHE